ncbi:unannotated protein [freshwater metagenome]|uniref:Unannotated protein n=1 Tax=freshwater metagenome TaxID=449393 RepID=A0A6J6UUR1_9ZZZZ
MPARLAGWRVARAPRVRRAANAGRARRDRTGRRQVPSPRTAKAAAPAHATSRFAKATGDRPRPHPARGRYRHRLRDSASDPPARTPGPRSPRARRSPRSPACRAGRSVAAGTQAPALPRGWRASRTVVWPMARNRTEGLPPQTGRPHWSLRAPRYRRSARVAAFRLRDRRCDSRRQLAP